MTRIRLDVVVPAHNAARFLDETLPAFAAQTEPADTVWVVDDRSTDGTREVAERLARMLAPRLDVRVLANAGPPGPAAARNTGIRASMADLVALVDADDLVEPDHHAACRAMFELEPEAVFAFGNARIVGPHGVLVEDLHARHGLTPLFGERLALEIFRSSEALFGQALLGAPFATSATVFRRHAALACGLLAEDLRYCEDTDFFVRLFLAGPVLVSTRCFVSKRQHDTNLSRDPRIKYHPCLVIALDRLRERAAGRREPTLSLPPARLAAIEEAMRKTFASMAYAASGFGLGPYVSVLRLALRMRLAAGLVRPRDLARSIAASLGLVAPPQPA